MRGVDIHLYIRGIMPADQALQHPSTSHRFHKLRSLAQDAIESVLINSGPTGRFEHTLTLDPSPHIESCIRDGVKKVLRLEAAFDSGLGNTRQLLPFLSFLAFLFCSLVLEMRTRCFSA